MPTEKDCPKCNGTKIIANKWKFGSRRAVGSAILISGFNLLTKKIQNDTILITCLTCGHRFKPGEKKIAVS